MKVCIKCGAAYKKKNGKFCSLKCFAESMKVYRPCPICGVNFSGPKDVKTCSKKCSYKTRVGSGNPMFKDAKLSANCKGCNKLFTYYKGASSGKYCCQKCSYASAERNGKMSLNKTKTFNGEPDRVIKARIRASKEYKKWCRLVFERDNFKCVQCGSKKKIQAHHIIPFSFIYKEVRLTGLTDLSPLFQIDNGKTLCELCHKKTDSFFNGKDCIELKLMKAIENGFKKNNEGYPDFDSFYKAKLESFINIVKNNLL